MKVIRVDKWFLFRLSRDVSLQYEREWHESTSRL
jgi:hypothetical protein